MSDGKMSDNMKYLCGRAKKMTAKLSDSQLPSLSDLKGRFETKGTEVTIGQCRTMIAEIKRHRKEKGIGRKAGGRASKAKPVGKPRLKAPKASEKSSPAPEKEKPKREVAPRQKSQSSYGAR